MLYQNENIGGCYDFRSKWHDQFIVPTHLHEYTELAHVQKGTAQIWIRNHCFTVKAGETILILPNQFHAYHLEPPSELICAVFSNDFVPGFFRRLGQCTLSTPVVDFSDCPELFRPLPILTTADELQITGLLNLICARMLQQGNPVPMEKHDGALYHKAINYITSHYATPMTLESMARELGYNTKYVSASLHRLTGMHFKRILAYYRVAYARQLLRNTPDEKMSEIAYHCGFSSINTFNREFKAIVGVSPRTYRTNGGVPNEDIMLLTEQDKYRKG